MVAAPLDQLTKSKDSPLRFQPVDQAERQKLSSACGKRSRDSAKSGKSWKPKRRVLQPKRATKEFVPARVKLPGSPIVAKPVAELGKDHAPPKMYEAPKPDPKVEPKPRANRSVTQPQQHQATPQPRGNGSGWSASGGTEAGKTPGKRQGQRQELSAIRHVLVKGELK